MQRTDHRRPAPTPQRGRARWTGLAAVACALLLAACTGGSGSSGFDLALQRENKAIDNALTEQMCEMNEGLIICPSGVEAPTPTATRAAPASSATPTAPADRTPTGGNATHTAQPQTPTPTVEGSSNTPTPTDGNVTASPTPSAPGATATRTTTPPAQETITRTPTFTPLPPSAPGIGTNVGESDTLSCTLLDAQNPCIFVFSFEPIGLPSGSAFRVGVRTRDPNGNWRILPVANNSALIEIDTSPSGPDYQIAVLVYESDPGPVPDEVVLLSDSGADYAFVTQVLMLVTP